MADNNVIATLEARIRQLIDRYRQLAGRCAELDAQCAALRSENRALEERVKRLDAQLARAELAGGLAGAGRDREKARARVNRLMREVDKCIALLSGAGDRETSEKDRRIRTAETDDAGTAPVGEGGARFGGETETLFGGMETTRTDGQRTLPLQLPDPASEGPDKPE